jgi:hypothetical protein
MLTRSIVVIRKTASACDNSVSHIARASLTATSRSRQGGESLRVEEVGTCWDQHLSAEMPHCVDPPRADNVRLPARARPTTKTLERAQPAIVQRPRMKASVLPLASSVGYYVALCFRSTIGIAVSIA